MQHIPEDDDSSLERWVDMHNRREEPHVYYPRIERLQRWAIAALAIALVIACVFAAVKANAQTLPRNAAEVSWTNATTNTDGTAIPATCPGETVPPTPVVCGKLLHTRIEYGTCNGTAFGTRQGEIVVAMPGSRVVVSDLVVQTYCFRGFHRNDFNIESASSNIFTKTIEPPTPRPPQIAVDTLAYEIKPNSSGVLVATRVGLVPMGTACGDRQQTVGTVTYSIVPRETIDMVNWPANVRLQDVWARCSVNL